MQLIETIKHLIRSNKKKKRKTGKKQRYKTVYIIILKEQFIEYKEKFRLVFC